MDFFKTLLSDEPDPPEHSPKSPNQTESGSTSDPNPNPSENNNNVWSFGDLIKTISTRSESVIETYRKDLKEFGSGLKKETDLFREVAGRVVKDLPSEIDGVLKSTAEIITQRKDSGPISSERKNSFNDSNYSRFDVQLERIRNDLRTYCDEPEDSEDFSRWKMGFHLGEMREEVERLVGEGGVMEGLYKKVVPGEVDDSTFWFRYFYRVHRLRLQEDVRKKLVGRSLSADYDEELSWDVDDDDEEEGEVVEKAAKNDSLGEKESGQFENVGSSKDGPKSENSGANVEIDDKNVDSKVEASDVVGENMNESVVDENKNGNVVIVEKGDSAQERNENVVDEKVEPVPVTSSDEKFVENAGSCKDSDVSVVSTQPSLQEEEDLGWDEIEDLDSNVGKRVAQGETSNKGEVKKPMSGTEDDEDLSWDIEDDDEPVKLDKK